MTVYIVYRSKAVILSFSYPSIFTFGISCSRLIPSCGFMRSSNTLVKNQYPTKKNQYSQYWVFGYHSTIYHDIHEIIIFRL